MDYDDKDLADFQFGSLQESKIEPPLVIDSIWDYPGITLDIIEDDLALMTERIKEYPKLEKKDTIL